MGLFFFVPSFVVAFRQAHGSEARHDTCLMRADLLSPHFLFARQEKKREEKGRKRRRRRSMPGLTPDGPGRPRGCSCKEKASRPWAYHITCRGRGLLLPAPSSSHQRPSEFDARAVKLGASQGQGQRCCLGIPPGTANHTCRAQPGTRYSLGTWTRTDPPSRWPGPLCFWPWILSPLCPEKTEDRLRQLFTSSPLEILRRTRGKGLTSLDEPSPAPKPTTEQIMF